MKYSPFFAALIGVIPIATLAYVVAEVTPLWYILQAALMLTLTIAGIIDGRRLYLKEKNK